jgi:hypothetical protein
MLMASFIKAISFISAPHPSHFNGSTSYTFAVNLAQFFEPVLSCGFSISLLKDAGLEPVMLNTSRPTIESCDMILHHHKTHQPIQLSPQQALCLKLLAQGKSAKEIGQELEISRYIEQLLKIDELVKIPFVDNCITDTINVDEHREARKASGL